MRFLTVLSLSIILYSCGGSTAYDIYTLEAPRKDFTDVLTLEGVVEPIRSTTLVCPAYVDGIVVFLVEDGTWVEKGDTLCIIEDVNLTEQYDNWTTSLETTKAHVEKVAADLRMNFALLEAQVQTNNADTKMAERDSLELLYASPRERKIKELEFEKLALEKTKLDRKLETLKVIDQTEIKRWEVEIQRLETNLRSIEERINSMVLIAPVKGLAVRAVNRMTREKLLEGDNVWTNIPIVHIPETEQVKVNITAAERDFKYVSVGDSVRFTFDAMPGNYAFGKITNKTPVGREMSRGSKVKVFDIEASVDSVAVMPDPGLSANCHVVTRELKDTIVIPRISVFQEDTLQVVYVQDRRKFERRQVATGMFSTRETVITAGLSAGEVVSMEKPPVSLIRGFTALPDSVAATAVTHTPDGDTEGAEEEAGPDGPISMETDNQTE